MICNVEIHNSVAIWSGVEYSGKYIKPDQQFVTLEVYEKLLKEYEELKFRLEGLEK